MAFDLSDYQTVQERIEIFWRHYPNGRIVNKIVRLDDKGVVVKCSVWRGLDDKTHFPEPDAVDYAQENITDRGINATSFVENCTSSATGRALSLLGGELSPSKKRASQTEMEKAARSRDWWDEIESLKTRQDALNLLNDAKAFNAPADVISGIVTVGQQLADKEKTSIGKEQTMEVQA